MLGKLNWASNSAVEPWYASRSCSKLHFKREVLLGIRDERWTLIYQQLIAFTRLWFFHWSCMDVRVDCEESRVSKNWRFWTVVLKKTLESPLDFKEIQPAHPKGDQSWVFIGRTDAEAETPILWPPHVKSWLTGKDPDAGRDWGQEEKGMTEDEMAGWHHWLNELEFE